jgi:superfamily II DNA/RNA helicase
MHALLRAYTDAMCIERPDAWLAMSVLHKRALSSAWALARSVERRLDALTTTRPAPAEQLRLPLWDRDGEYSDADESPPWPPGIGLADVEHDAQMLGRLLACARTAAMHDSKLAALRRLLRRAREPAIVFTEFRDTLLHVQQVLGRPAVVLHGGLTADERSKALNDFAAGRRPVLLATDAGGEGLNLHHAARLVVNLELPWNPVRLEQRVGRVDRIGQRRRVHAFHLVARDTGEARILDRLRTRIATAHDDLALDRAFGSDEERAVAQLAILGTAAADETAAEPIAAALEWPDLAGESTREADRLARARAMQSADDNRPSPDRQSPIDRPLIWRTRRARLRAALGRRALLLWRVRCEDASGHIVGSTLVPIYVDVASPTSLRPRREIARWLADAEDRTRPLVLAATADWHAHVEEQRRAFIAARRTREASIAGAPTPNRDARFQPGLFDRRAERRRLIAAAGSHDDEVERRQRLDALNRSEAIDRSEAELLLVLLPPGTGERFETD